MQTCVRRGLRLLLRSGSPSSMRMRVHTLLPGHSRRGCSTPLGFLKCVCGLSPNSVSFLANPPSGESCTRILSNALLPMRTVLPSEWHSPFARARPCGEIISTTTLVCSSCTAPSRLTRASSWSHFRPSLLDPKLSMSFTIFCWPNRD